MWTLPPGLVVVGISKTTDAANSLSFCRLQFSCHIRIVHPVRISVQSFGPCYGDFGMFAVPLYVGMTL